MNGNGTGNAGKGRRRGRLKTYWAAFLSWVCYSLHAGDIREQLMPVPVPDTSAMEEPIQEKIAELKTRLDQARQDSELENLGAAYGALADFYHAHKLSEAAAVAYENARLLFPSDGRWSYYLGLIHMSEGRLEEAAADFETCVTRDENHLAALIRLGNIRLDQGRTEDAESAFRRVLRKDSLAAAALFGMGKVAAARNDREAAIDWFEQTLALQPQASQVHYSLALAYRRLGDLEKAKQHLQQRGEGSVRFSDPLLDRLLNIVANSSVMVLLDMAAAKEDFSARSFLGFVKSKFKNRPGVATYLKNRVLEMTVDPDRDPLQLARLHFALAGLDEETGQSQSALSHYLAALRFQPDFVEARYRLGNLYGQLRNYRNAIDCYSMVLASNPDEGRSLLARGTTHFILHEDEKARVDLEKLSVLDPGAAQARFRLGLIYQRGGDHAKAAEQFERVVGQDLPDREKAAAHSYLGDFQKKIGDLEAAENHYRQALRLYPGGETNLKLADLLATLDRHEEAAGLYAESINTNPGHEEARRGQIANLLTAGRYAEAAASLEEAHSLMPESRKMTFLLARFLATAPDPDLRNPERALGLSQDLLALGKTVPYAETLAMALARVGRFEEAVHIQQTLLEAAEQAGQAEIAERLFRNLVAFQNGKACCDNWSSLLALFSSSD